MRPASRIASRVRARARPSRMRLHDRWTGMRLALRPRLALGEAYMDGKLTVEDGDIYDLLDLLGRNMAALEATPLVQWSYALQRWLRFLEQYNPIGRAAAQRRPSLRPQRPALRLLPRPRPAVFLRLLQDRRRAAGAGPARQEAAHRRQAAAAARPEGARHRLGLGRHGPVPQPAVRRRRDRRHPLQGTARRLEPARPRGRRGRPRALQAARLSPGARPLRPHRLGRHVRACRRRPLRRVLHQGEGAAGRRRRHAAAFDRPHGAAGRHQHLAAQVHLPRRLHALPCPRC